MIWHGTIQHISRLTLVLEFKPLLLLGLDSPLECDQKITILDDQDARTQGTPLLNIQCNVGYCTGHDDDDDD